jgi:hypothetical protein
MTLSQPPIFMVAKHESPREPVGSALRWRFDCRSGDEMPLEPLTQKKSNGGEHPVQSLAPAHGNLGVCHATRAQTLSAKGLTLRSLR